MGVDFFKKYKLLVGVLLGLFTGLVLPFLVNYLTSEYIDAKKNDVEAKTKVAEKFIADLERIKVATPYNVNLEDCLNKNLVDEFNVKYEKCISRLKQDENIPHVLLDRNLSSIKLFFGDEFYNGIEKDIGMIDFLLYDISNNQYVIYRWKNNGCSDMVDFVDAKDLTEEKFNANNKCALSIEATKNFLERANENCNNDCISALRSDVIDNKNVGGVIIPGSQISLEQTFREWNSSHYVEISRRIDNILNKIREEISD